MMYKLSEGTWCAYVCARCGVTYKRPPPHALKRSNIDSGDCDLCGLPAKIVWGVVVGRGKDAYFVPETPPTDDPQEA